MSIFNEINGISNVNWENDFDLEKMDVFYKPSEVLDSTFTLIALCYTTKGKYGDSIIMVNDDNTCVWCPASQVESVKRILSDEKAIEQINHKEVTYHVESYENKRGQTGYKLIFKAIED